MPPTARHATSRRRPSLRPAAHPPPWMPAAADPDGSLHDLEDVGHHLGIGDLAIEDDLGTDLADLHLGAGNAWLTRVSSSFVSSVTRTRNETGRLVSSQRVRLVVPNDLPKMFRSRAVGLIGQQLDVGDVRVGDHHPGQRSSGSG